MSAGLAASTVTPGSTAPDVSLTIPAIPLAPKPAPPKERTAIEVSPSVLERYAGAYQLAPEFVIEVSVQNGALYAQPTNQSKLRLWAETQRDFFFKEVDAQVTFVVDDSGSVSALVLHQNGADQRARKVR